jgi:O-antigen ligase
MPPVLALTLCLSFSLVLLVRESYQQKNVSRAVWIPCIWLLILGSRPISMWLGLGGQGAFDSMMEGSPVDRTIYLVLMLLGLVVVIKRRLVWRDIFHNNLLLFLFLAYCAVSVAWSDFPFIAFKRWFKSLGDPLMALILLSEATPGTAIVSVLRRLAFVFVPLSIVFIKYLPQYGRGYDGWSGMAYYTGVSTNKNMLGYLLLVFGLLFLCALFTRRREEEKAAGRTDAAIALLFLGMIAWLIRMANSQTSLVALFVSSAVVISLSSRQVRKYFGGVTLAVLSVVLCLEWTFSIVEVVLEILGRDPTLTGRTDIWAAVLTLAGNPFVGAGFQSFWLGDRLAAMWAKFPVFMPNQAHNGYLEIYLNLGWIGLLLFLGVVIAAYRSLREKLERAISAVPLNRNDLIIAKFGIGYLVAYVLYNVTEAIFQPLNFLFIVFLVLGIRYPMRSQKSPAPAATRVPRRAHLFAEPIAASATRASAQWKPTSPQVSRFRGTWARTDHEQPALAFEERSKPSHSQSGKPMTSWRSGGWHRAKSSR